MNLRTLGLSVILVVAFGVSARAQLPVLLVVDDGNPSAVTITSTGADAAVSDSSTNENDGIDLLEFLPAPVVLGDPIVISGLIPAGATTPYNSYFIDNYSGPSVDFNAYFSNAITVGGGSTVSPYDIQTFSPTSPAFTGSWTLDLSSFSSLPAPGTSGAILAGNSFSPGHVIGTWTAVPEPSHYGLFVLLALAGLIAWRRFSAPVAIRS